MTADMIILYVTNPAASADFYARILGLDPADLSPGFAMFVLPSGLKLGLWIREGVKPASDFTGCGSEIVIHTKDAETVESTHKSFAAAGIPVIDPPTAREFGLSFVVADPDGHRVRVMHPAG